MRLRRWALRQYHTPTGEMISDHRYIFRWSAAATIAWHGVLVRRRDPNFRLRVERV